MTNNSNYGSGRNDDYGNVKVLTCGALFLAACCVAPEILDGIGRSLVNWRFDSVKTTYNNMLIKRHKKGWLPKDEDKLFEFVTEHEEVLPISRSSGNLVIGIDDDERLAKIKAKGWYKGIDHKKEQSLLDELYSEYDEYEDSVATAKIDAYRHK